MSRRALAWIVALGLTARLLVLPYTLPRYAWGQAYPDTVQYEAMASNLRAGRGLVVGPGAEAVRPPLYPLVLAAFQSAFGEGRAFALAVILAQALLGALGCALAADLGGRLFGPAAGRVAGVVSALHPELLLYPSLLLTETLAAVLVTAALWAAARAIAAASPGRWALLCGACCGAAALTRASLLPLAGMAALWLAWALPLRRKALAAAACCTAAACAVIGPWTIRNRLLLGAWVPVTTKMGWDLYEQFCPEATGGPIYGTIRWPPEVRDLGEVEADRALRRAAWRRILAQPGRAAALTLIRVRRLWNPFPNDPEHRTPVVMAVSLLANLPLFLLALASVTLLRQAPAAWTLAALPVLLLGLVHAVFMGSVRYRAPALPTLGVLAGAALGRLRKAPDP